MNDNSILTGLPEGESVDHLYLRYCDMSIWDPRYSYCRFFVYKLLENMARECKITTDLASGRISHLNDKFYNENYSSRDIQRITEGICSSFMGNSSVFLLDKVSYRELRLAREKMNMWMDFYDNSLPEGEEEINRVFISYATNVCINILAQYEEDPNQIWTLYVQLVNDVKQFYLERPYMTSVDEFVREALIVYTNLYYDVLEGEYELFRSKGVDVDVAFVDSLTLREVQLSRSMLLDFLDNPNKMADKEKKYSKDYTMEEIDLAYQHLYGMHEESIYMKLERCVNRLEDFSEMNAGLCRHTFKVATGLYDEAAIICDLTDDTLLEYTFNFFYLPTISAASNGEYQKYLDNLMMCLSNLRILWEEGAVQAKDIFRVKDLLTEVEVDEMILGVRDEITEACIEGILEEGEPITIIQEVKTVSGIKVYEEVDEIEPASMKVDTLDGEAIETTKKMSLGGE